MEEKEPAKPRSREPWIIDSGASNHLCYKKEEFSELRELSSPKKIVLGDNRVIEATHEGRVDLDLRVGGEIQSATLSKVLYVPEIKKKLVFSGELRCSGQQPAFHGERSPNFQ